jgi:hypothetical protein
MRGINKRGQFLYKKGQFYLIAGIIIISVIIGLIGVVNYVKKSQTVLVGDLKEEIKIESQKVLENKVAQGGDPMNQYGLDYSSHLGNDIELYFIVGEDPNIEAYKYVNGFRTDVSEYLTIDGGNQKIIFELNEISYEFNLMETENFYYLIVQEIKEESFVAVG